MTTFSHEPAAARPWWLEARDVWASLAISAVWLAVGVTAIFGADMQFHDVSGSGSTIPSAVAVALFAMVASFGIAKHGFAKQRD
jgi:hypothetical protein